MRVQGWTSLNSTWQTTKLVSRQWCGHKVNLLLSIQAATPLRGWNNSSVVDYSIDVPVRGFQHWQEKISMLGEWEYFFPGNIFVFWSRR